MKLLPKNGTSEKNMPMLLLLAACIPEFLFIILERQFFNLGYYLAETYLMVPCLLFLGYVLRENPSRFASKPFLLALAAFSWFFIVQLVHRLSGMGNQPLGTVLFVHLMAFPFAVLTDDRKSTGLRLVGGMFMAASLVLVFYALLLFLNLVPSWMAEYLYWDGARILLLWHPNVSACYFMIGSCFSLAFLTQAQKKSTKAALAAATVLQLAAMALTNCRTIILLTGAILGGTLFFLIARGGWKRFVLGLLVAALVLVGFFKASGALFHWNNDRLIVSYYETLLPEEESFYEDTVMPELEEILEGDDILWGDNGQNSLSEDLWTFNNRIYVWQAALMALRDSKPMLLAGTEFSGTVISVYLGYDPYHAHNSWIETFLRTGFPGLLIYLVFTVLSIWRAAQLLLSQGAELWKKIMAMLAMCIMASGFLESYLFIADLYYHVPGFVYFFLTGYLDFWCQKPRTQET